MTPTLSPAGYELMSVPQAAGELKISRATLFRLLADGRLRSVRIGTRRLVPAVDLAAYVESLRGQP